MNSGLQAQSFSQWLVRVLDQEQRCLIESDDRQVKRTSAQKIISVTNALDVLNRCENEISSDFSDLLNMYFEAKTAEEETSLFKMCVDVAYDNIELRFEQLDIDVQNLQFEMLIYEDGIKLYVVSPGMSHQLIGVDSAEPELVRVLEQMIDHFAPDSVVKKCIEGKCV